ncbi:terminase ATPase subunit family protein [Pandoraea nosoerga]|uniref:terminase ATPase subunit family protein n=1 Tax=Pandoraea nosoerga TaxID=2508296 RepID=UPI001981CB11|nr:terminase ATPase subunit family protein [Pandoraea nosoerga]MBN4667218.1 terminase ATPase subunit family protein [Pandoraea nosoerga]MBN4677205.1 terminase ATPase subunit family protein [Pandoraea nosoerga]MBN4681973.1 terminase ATPase subunit family protein [Pandoraea nosoerga]MBN4746291.1 terminase ATPase subunit family protein [Pandoraea nosoerga]
MTQQHAPDIDPRVEARNLYFAGWRVARIAEKIGEKRSTVHSWCRRDKWKETAPVDRVELSLEARMIELVRKENKEGKDFKEIDLLGRQIERMQRVHKYQQTGNEVDLNPKIASRNSGPRKKAEKNSINEKQLAQLRDAFMDSIFDYQRAWYEAGDKYRIRNILKSRQIGATWYFAREALIDALDTGRNQIFLSASKAQAHVFQQYIKQFAKDAADVELTGSPMHLPHAGANLYFLGTNARTAQSYHGNLYFDEYFWTSKFQELRKVASGMAIHKHWRQTYFSTPSNLAHEAYPFWSGALFNRGRKKDERIQLDLSHKALARGVLCPDGQWRQIVTVEDALAGGCNLFDLEQLRLEYGPDDFANLLMCQFVDDVLAVFKFSLLQGCMVDSWEVWDDYRPFAARPFGYRPVWLGYDPNGGSGMGDSAALVVLAPPVVQGGKFRILERIPFRGLDYEAQAEAIRKATERYTVTYIGIDRTGIGDAVFQLVKKFFPAVFGFTYSPHVKTQLVLKAHDVMSKGRLEFDAGHTDIAQSFMTIRRTTTASGGQVTYKADRSAEASHGDIAWATMHAMWNEGIDGQTGTNQGFMEMYS